MPKTQIKYITKPNEEVLNYIQKTSSNFNKDETRINISSFLKDFNNFGLYLYAFSKLAGVIFFTNNEENKTLSLKDCYLENPNNFDYVIDFLKNKFLFYSLEIKMNKDRMPLKSVIKKYKFTLLNDLYIIKL